ncbi:MAG: serine--tRNA ligase [Candidatus Ryanbacteria bacterium RIFCSPHIGHO2_02_FULL_45_13b]|uniref:Serine--tRNA ligase n=1 Tax=Candidatus Ryanbacteria bacterium RIFCSPHIGHO2_02_FULL_45_13b TaxID=1802117 RepID=A0A1G2G3R1_9BACT|nr:MAG: serine--tRNA ligase [Candidatus Ryanbacteria bacterium RIFCSPHIGHO2_02_FULL_45_13b]
MLDIAFIKEYPDIVRIAMRNKNREVDLDRILLLADERKRVSTEIGDINHKRNEAASLRDAVAGKSLKEESRAAEEKFQVIDTELQQLLYKLPNVPSADTPIGPDESGNKVIREWGQKSSFSFTPKAHWDIGKDLGIINSEKAAEISGARFTYIMGDLALLQFALLQFSLQVLTSQEELKKIVAEAGLSVSAKPFIPVVPPMLMRSRVMEQMARLDPIEDRYYFEKDDVVFVGSAEHTLGPLHMDEALNEADLPIRYVGYSTAFRREAGSYGKDTKGILRQHQFDKIEMESFARPEDGIAEQDFFVAIQEHLMRLLMLPYQVMLICTGDMGFPDQRQIDINTWMPGQNTYRETHSADYVGGFQARRLNTRVKRLSGNSEPVHMNDATVFAMGRTLIAILENYQQEDGSVMIPEVLQKWVGKERIMKHGV